MKKPTLDKNGQVVASNLAQIQERKEPLTDPSNPITHTYTIGKKGSVESRSITHVQTQETGS